MSGALGGPAFFLPLGRRWCPAGAPCTFACGGPQGRRMGAGGSPPTRLHPMEGRKTAPQGRERDAGARSGGCYLGHWPETGGGAAGESVLEGLRGPQAGWGRGGRVWGGEGLGVLDSPSVVGDGDGAVLEGDVHTGGAGPPGVLEKFVEAFRRGGVEEPGDLLDGVLVDGCPDFLGQGWGAHVCVLLWRCCAGFTAATRFSGGLSVFFCADVPIFPCSGEHGLLPSRPGVPCGSGVKGGQWCERRCPLYIGGGVNIFIFSEDLAILTIRYDFSPTPP